jgi:sugar phosphate isomerase/epimerase
MSWPKGKAERRYGGVTHIDADEIDQAQADFIREMMGKYKVAISGLGYYPNPLCGDSLEGDFYARHIRKVILAAEMLGVGVINTFIGCDQLYRVEDNWARFRRVWPPLVEFAADHSVRIGIENCPMRFTKEQWPGGQNMAHSPAVWRRMFEEIPSPNFGLNFDPSHLVWQGIDILRAVREFAGRFVHVHAKDARVNPNGMYEYGCLADDPALIHTPKLPGLGEVPWGGFFAELTNAGYDGPVCVEVEDRAYEGSLERRKTALEISYRFLRQFVQ